jgi:NAD(P)-dependent dehydrogenase (short-subunit alcohol dehydrogenase family)
MSEAFIPLLKKGGRLVNVASVASHLNGYSQETKQKLRDSTHSVSAVSDLVDEYEVSGGPYT